MSRFKKTSDSLDDMMFEVNGSSPEADGHEDGATVDARDEADARSRRPSLSALLTQVGILTEDQIQEALAQGERTGEKLGEVVVRLGWASEEQLASLLAEQWGLKAVDAGALALDPLAVARLEPAIGAELGGYPVWFDKHGTVVAIAEPSEERFSAFRELLGNVTFVIVSRTVLRELSESRLFRSDPRSPRSNGTQVIAAYIGQTDDRGVTEPDPPSAPPVSANGASPSEAPPVSANGASPPAPTSAPGSVEAQLHAIAVEVRQLEHALDEARRTIETRESELATLRTEHERDVSTIGRLEHELGERSRRLDGLREKVADLSQALEA